MISGHNIRGGFCSKTDDIVNPYIDEKIAADHKGCFDKWSKCPISLPLPTNRKEWNFLRDKLQFLGTKEGFELSDSYEMRNINEYPKRR